MEIETSLSLGDWHYEDYMIPYQQFLDYGQQVNPTYLNLMGDIADCEPISHHNSEERKIIGFDEVKKRFHSMIDGLKDILRVFRRTFKRATITYVPGNHEEWICQYAIQVPQLDKRIDWHYSHRCLEELLELKKIGINIIPFGESFNIGKLYFRHGHEYGTMFPAKQAVLHSHKSVAIWHHHTRQSYTTYSDIDDAEYCGYAVPCYCLKGLKYGKGKPNRWTNGFLWGAHKRSSGKFTAGIITTSKRGDFMTADGKEFTL